MSDAEEWIVARGLWPVSGDPAGVPIPDDVLADPDLSLMAKGLYALLLAQPGRPVNPYEDAYEEHTKIAVAIEELVGAGLVVRVDR